nr:unnamed protein product [Digitaria exilis]
MLTWSGNPPIQLGSDPHRGAGPSRRACVPRAPRGDRELLTLSRSSAATEAVEGAAAEACALVESEKGKGGRCGGMESGRVAVE